MSGLTFTHPLKSSNDIFRKPTRTTPQGLAALLWSPQALILHLFVHHTVLETADDVFSPHQSVNWRLCFVHFGTPAPSTRPGTQYFDPQLVLVEWVRENAGPMDLVVL